MGDFVRHWMIAFFLLAGFAFLLVFVGIALKAVYLTAPVISVVAFLVICTLSTIWAFKNITERPTD